MRFLQACLTLLLTTLLAGSARGNTEKIDFIAPASVAGPKEAPGLDALRLEVLSASHSTLRKALPVAFPTDAAPLGQTSWYLLQGLNPGQRYEEPTKFSLEAYNISHVWETPELIESLTAFSELQLQLEHRQHHSQPEPQHQHQHPAQERLATTISLLRLESAADYFSTNATLMLHPPAVRVDLILDPHIANFYPASLLPTTAYLLVLLVASYFLSGALWTLLLQRPETRPESKIKSKRRAD